MSDFGIFAGGTVKPSLLWGSLRQSKLDLAVTKQNGGLYLPPTSMLAST